MPLPLCHHTQKQTMGEILPSVTETTKFPSIISDLDFTLEIGKIILFICLQSENFLFNSFQLVPFTAFERQERNCSAESILNLDLVRKQEKLALTAYELLTNT